MTKFKCRIYVAHTPFRGPPSPQSHREWAAYSLDPVPAVQTSTEFGRSITFYTAHPVFYGHTREEAIQLLSDHVRECLAVVRNHGTTFEEATIEVDCTTDAERKEQERALQARLTRGPH